MIQKLKYDDEEYSIGISEISNSNRLTMDELLILAKDFSQSILALQFFNSSLIVDEMHLLSAAQNAVNAWKGNYMITRSLDVEMIVYASTQRQIHEALSLLGVTDNLDAVCVIILDKDEKKVRKILDDIIFRVGDIRLPPFSPSIEKIDALMKIFDIGETEMQHFLDSDTLESRNRALSKCIVSRVTLVALGT